MQTGKVLNLLQDVKKIKEKGFFFFCDFMGLGHGGGLVCALSGKPALLQTGDA